MFKVCALCWSLFVIVFSGAAFGDDNIAAQMAQMAESSMRDSCNDTAFLSCVGAKVPACKTTVNTAIEQCRFKFPKKISPSNTQSYSDTVLGEWSICVTEKIQTALKISDELMTKCDAQSSDNDGESQAQIPDMSPEQYKAELEKVGKQMLAASQSHAQSVGTSDVTLPIYKNSSVVSRMDGPQVAQFLGTQTALPVVGFVSPDSLDTVTRFYKNNLKGFRQHKFANGVVFVEGDVAPTGVNDLGLLVKLAAYQHVMIAPVEADNKVLAGSKSTISISFKK